MPNSKTATGSGPRGYGLQLRCTETSTSIEDNTSSISWSLVLTAGSSWYFIDYWAGWNVKINGTSVSYAERGYKPISVSRNGETTITSGTTTVAHNTDGTKTISIYAETYMPYSDAGPGDMSTSSESWALTTIPRASSMTLPSSFTINSSGSITVQMASNTFSHTITYSGLGLSGTVATLNAGVSSTSWTPTTSFYQKLPNATSGTVSLTLTTKSGATTIGSKSYDVTINVPTSIKPTAPTVTLSPVNTNAWFNTKGLYVGGYTKVRVQSSASAGTGASISSYSISGAFSGTGADYTSGILTAGSKSITVTATDSRGRSNATTKTATFVTYTYPGLTTFTAVRGTYSGGSWTSNVNGDHIRVEAVATVSLSGNGNTATKTVKIGNTNPSATSGNYYYFTGTTATSSYTITGTVTDSVGYSTSRTLTVPTIEVPLNINVDLPGIGVGMIAQTAHNFEVAPAWAIIANGRNNRYDYMPYSAIISGTSGTDGYLRIASVTNTDTWVYGSIEFDVCRLYDTMPVRLSLYFESGSSIDPTTVYLRYDNLSGSYVNRPFTAFVTQTGATLDVYVYKCTTGSERITVRTYQSAWQMDHSIITYPGGQMSSIPSGAKMATPLPPIYGTLTASSGVTVVTNKVFIDKSIVHVQFYGTRNSNYYADTGTKVGEISGVPLPPYAVRFVVGTGASYVYLAYHSAYGLIDTSGNISITVPSANIADKAFVIDVSYPVA